MKQFHATEFTARDPDGRFTAAELEVYAWMAEGKDNVTIGMLRGHGLPGARKLASSVMRKLEANSRCLAVARGFALGYLIAKDLKQSPRHLLAVALFLTGTFLSPLSADNVDHQRRGPRSARFTRNVRLPRHEMGGLLTDWMDYAA